VWRRRKRRRRRRNVKGCIFDWIKVPAEN